MGWELQRYSVVGTFYILHFIAYGSSVFESVDKAPNLFLGAFHLRKKPGNFGGSKSGISDW